MKRFLIIVALIAMSAHVFAQRGGGAPNWISIAAKAGMGTSITLCQELSDVDGASQEYFNPAFNYGARLGVVFVDRIGLSLEYLGGQMQQKFSVAEEVLTKNLTANSNLKFKTSDILVLARFTGEYGFYAELGPKFTSIKEVTREFDGDGSEFFNLIGGGDAKEKFNGKFNSIVFGLGGNVFNGDRVQVGLGVRFAYCPKNILTDNASSDPWFDIPATNVEVKPLSAQVMLDINYHFARFGQATCGKQRIIFFK